jgi:hypothetical protein
MNYKFFLAVLAASLIAFLGGWLIFGVVFSDYYSSHTLEGARLLIKEPPEMWAIALANVAWALLVTWILEKTASINFTRGFLTGMWVSFLVVFIFDISMYSFWEIYDLGFLCMDIFITTIFWGLIGGVAGAILGSGTKIRTNT